MKKPLILIIFNLLFFVIPACGAEQKSMDHYFSQHKLSTGMTVVVAEGELEPRSMGSFSIRIYGASLEFPTDEFLCGIVRARDGVVERVIIQDINEDGIEEIIIVVRSAGSGSYLSADAFQFQLKGVLLVAKVANLGKNANPVKELINKLKSK